MTVFGYHSVYEQVIIITIIIIIITTTITSHHLCTASIMRFSESHTRSTERVYVE